jgi:hypothetical protein
MFHQDAAGILIAAFLHGDRERLPSVIAPEQQVAMDLPITK